MKINPDVKELWVETLRSGRYKQGFTYLRWNYLGSETFTVTGVLCDLAVKAGVLREPWCEELERDVFVYRYGSEGNARTLPKEVYDWLGVERSSNFMDNPLFHLESKNNELSFEELANIIETDF